MLSVSTDIEACFYKVFIRLVVHLGGDAVIHLEYIAVTRHPAWKFFIELRSDLGEIVGGEIAKHHEHDIWGK